MGQTNQILIYEKIFVTPELKKKKKFYKLEFILSFFVLCILFSYYIYAEYDRNKSEEVSKGILGSINISDTTTIDKEKNEYILVYLNNTEPDPEPIEEPEIIQTTQVQSIYTQNGVDYETVRNY